MADTQSQQSDANWDRTGYTQSRNDDAWQQYPQDDPWRQASNPRRNAANEPWPDPVPQNKGKPNNAPHGKGPDAAQQGKGPSNAQQHQDDQASKGKGKQDQHPQGKGDGTDIPLVPSRMIASAALLWCAERPCYLNRRLIIGAAHSHAPARTALTGAPHATLRPAMSKRTRTSRAPAVIARQTGRRARAKARSTACMHALQRVAKKEGARAAPSLPLSVVSAHVCHMFPLRCFSTSQALAPHSALSLGVACACFLVC